MVCKLRLHTGSNYDMRRKLDTPSSIPNAEHTITACLHLTFAFALTLLFVLNLNMFVKVNGDANAENVSTHSLSPPILMITFVSTKARYNT